MQKIKSLAASLIIAFGVAAGASAAVIVDGTPTGAYNGAWSNYSDAQNFLVQFTLAETSLIDSVDIFTHPSLAAVGTSTTVRFRTDAGGTPAASNLYEIIANVSSSSAFDGSSNRTSVNLSPFSLNAGTYWFGVSGTNLELSWNSYTTYNQQQQMLSNQTVVGSPGVGDFGYRINGTVGEVPEPGSVALLGLAIGGLLLARRKRAA